jgi:hypothetical protein
VGNKEGGPGPPLAVSAGGSSTAFGVRLFGAELFQSRAWFLGIVDNEGGGCYPTLKGGGAR